MTAIVGAQVSGANGDGSTCPNCVIEVFLDDADAITEALQIRWPVLSKNLCELRHGRVFQSWAMSALWVTLKVSMTLWVRWA